MNMFEKFKEYMGCVDYDKWKWNEPFWGDKQTQKELKILGIMVLIIITTTLLFPYNRWATDLLLSSKLTELFGFVFPETLTLLRELYSEETNIDVERYVAASVYGRVLALVLISVYFYRRWNSNIHTCQQIAMEYLKTSKETKSVIKTIVIVCIILLALAWVIYSIFFNATLRGNEVGYIPTNFISRWLYTGFIFLYSYIFLKCLLFLYIVFIKKSNKTI